jgi:hypothetical protein
MTIYTAYHGNDVFVQLTEEEVQKAWNAGTYLRNVSVAEGREDNPSLSGPPSRTQSLGTLAEMAVAKALGLTWKLQVGNTIESGHKEPDLPFNIEARLIGVQRYGLRIYDHDDPSLRVVGVVIPKGGEAGPYRIPGWINAVYAQKRPAWRMDPLEKQAPFFGVPQQSLFHLDELRRLIREEQGS